MATTLEQLFNSFEALSDEEKQQAAAELLRRTLSLVPADLAEEALVATAEGLFLDLDAREATDAQP